MLPSRLSHYRVLERIGAGGMGVVYRAHDEDLDRDVALKVLPAGTLADDNARQRFRREALALARLNHPNIGMVYEFGSQDQIDFLVMELISGLSLDAKLAAGPLPEVDIRRLGTQLADGLEAAHAQGIVHRDLKPGNLRLTSDGRLKILDFGLAQWTQPDSDSAQTATVTRLQEVSGTVPYMAPEQLRGQKADVRSDIYAAGVVLYEMACGKLPFHNISGPQLIGAILERQPAPPTTRNHRISPGLESIILKALDKDPGLRYQSARELQVDMERLTAGALPVAARKPRRWLPAAIGAAVVLLALLSLRSGTIRDRILGHGAAPAPVSSVKTRRSVAVLGFRNLSGRQDQAWLSTALAEMLSTELAAGEQLRTVPGETVVRMKRDLDLEDADSFAPDTLQKIRKRLGSDLLVSGTFLALGKDAGGQIRIDFRLQDAAAGDTIASVSETGTEGELLSLVSRTGEELRRKLGIGSVSPNDTSGVRASLPSHPEAARLYAEGLEKLRRFDAIEAEALLARAVNAEPDHALSHAALAEAWAALGYDPRAQQEAKKAFELSSTLSRADRLSVEGRFREITRDWPKATEIYKTLWDFFPDNVDYGLRLATVQTMSGQGKDALATVARLRELPSPAGDDPRIDLAEARAANSLGDFQRQQSAASTAAAKGNTQGARLVLAQARLSEAGALERLGQLEKAVASVTEAKEQFTAAGDRSGSATALQMSGDLLYDKGDYDGARRLFEESLKVYRDVGSEINAARALNNIGNVLYEQGKLADAKANYEQSLAIYRKIEVKGGVAGALGNIANVLDAMGQLPQALQMHEQSLQAFSDVGDRRGMASTYNNLGVVLSEMGRLAEAQSRFQQGADLHRQTSHRRGEAYSLSGLGDIAMARDDLKTARSQYDQALSIRRDMGEEATAAQNLVGLAALDLEEAQPAEAEKLAQQAAGAFARAKSAELEAVSYALLARARLDQHDLEGARGYSTRAGAILHSASASLPSRFEAMLAAARVSLASGQAVEAARQFNEVLRDASRLDYFSYALDARLGIAESEIRKGDAASARSHLRALESEAQAKGFLLMARKARKLRN